MLISLAFPWLRLRLRPIQSIDNVQVDMVPNNRCEKKMTFGALWDVAGRSILFEDGVVHSEMCETMTLVIDCECMENTIMVFVARHLSLTEKISRRDRAVKCT